MTSRSTQTPTGSCARHVIEPSTEKVTMSHHDEVPTQDTPTPRDEQTEILNTFRSMLQTVTADGARKRAAGLKPSWKIDPSHEAALFSHLSRWKHGEKKDPDSGVHPLIHLAWRALARAWQETVR